MSLVGGNVATLVPDGDLDFVTLYTAELTTAIADLAGNTLADPYSWSFTTANETTAPTVLSTVPDADALDVAVNSAITATFSEAIDASTLDGASFTLTPDGGAAITATVSLVGGNVATLVPDGDLDFVTLYTAELTTAIADLAGNTLVDPYSWSFTTANETTALQCC